MLKLYNTLTRSIEEFKPQNPPLVKMYSCGPTVYDYQHIGHMRRYVGDDILKRVLAWNGYKVKHVMNITDVGHLVSDADTGEDKMEKGAAKFGLSVWDIAKKFEKQFFESLHELNVILPDKIMHATDYIQAQTELIKVLEKKGYVYRIADGVYFDTSKIKSYTKLSHQNIQNLMKGARIDFVEGKKYSTDFALWKFSPKGEKRQMEWESPWGIGFPGWHIECSAMSLEELGPTLDIHTGGIDHIAIHHTNEIAQSEAATGHEFSRYWVHHNFLKVEGEKMSKSLGNIYTVEEIIRKGFNPLSLRYLYLQTHYRQEMNFTWESLTAAQTALKRLQHELWDPQLKAETAKAQGLESYEEQYTQAINDDLNMSKALSIVWEVLKSPLDPAAKRHALLRFDSVLGLQLDQPTEAIKSEDLADNVARVLKKREESRVNKDFEKSDELRNTLKDMGYEVEDLENGEQKVTKIPPPKPLE